MNWNQLRRLTIICVLTLTYTLTFAQDVSSDLLSRINALRGSLGTHQYTLNGALSAAAQNHAEWMISTGQVSHTQPDGSTPSSRAARFGYPSSAVSENIYMGTNATAETAWNWWLGSPIHYRGITNTAYTQVGIGSASGEFGTSFVLVFGNPNGWGAAPAAPANNTSGSTQRNTDNSQPVDVVAAPPVFVVGIDNVGNIMHEIQPGHTLGEIAFMYGYGWEDLEAIRQLNEMSEPDGRNLEVGSVLLIPPYEGTFTPTPGGPPPTEEPEVTVEVNLGITPQAPSSVVVIQSDAITPTPADEADLGILASPEPSAELSSLPPSVIEPPPPPTVGPGADVATEPWVAMTITPTPTAAGVAMANVEGDQAASPPESAQTSLTEPREVVIVEESNTPMWLIVAVVVQGLIILGAGLEYFRRSRRT